MASLTVLQVDAFAPRPFGGNPAAVVPDAAGLSARQMQALARELGVAGTGFVSPSGTPGVDHRLRVFTPACEVTYSGHTTLAVTHALAEAGRVPGDRLVFETAGGLLAVTLERRDDGTRIWLEPALPRCRAFDGPLEALLDTLGLASNGRAPWARPTLTPEADLLVPVGGLAPLHALRPDMNRLADVAAAAALRGLCLVSRETIEATSSTHSRFFAPHFGIPEDIVTGSVHSALAVWLWEAGQLPATGDRIALTAEQGDVLGRPGRLAIELHLAGGRPIRVRVGGSAVTVLRGTMEVP